MAEKFFGYPSCEQCEKKLTSSISKKQEEELVESIIETLKRHPISYAEAYRVLDCAGSKLTAMSNNLQL